MLVWRLRTGLRCFAYPLNDVRLIREKGKETDDIKERARLERQRIRDSLPSLDNEPVDAAEEEQMLREQEKSPRKDYKRKINKTQEDFLVERMREKDREFAKMVREYFANENSGFDKQNISRIEKTKRLTRAMRLNSVFDFVREKSPQSLAANYNNYDKFKLNFSYFYTKGGSDPFDNGIGNRQKMLADYISGLTPEGTFLDTEYGDAQLKEHGKKKPENEDEAMREATAEGEEDDKGEEPNHEEYSGRMSPHAKEEIFRLYENGWTVNDLSYRYGILPARVKAIIWCRRHFYEEVQPRVDEITWKLGVEREFLYASSFPFLDYGMDLQAMAHFEKGINKVRLTRSHIDENMPEVLKQKIIKKLTTVKPARRSFVVRGTVGKGPSAYKLKDMVVCYGNGRHSVSEMFKRVCMWGEKKPHWLPKHVEAKIHLGPRIAAQGYRMGGRMKDRY